MKEFDSCGQKYFISFEFGKKDDLYEISVLSSCFSWDGNAPYHHRPTIVGRFHLPKQEATLDRILGEIGPNGNHELHHEGGGLKLKNNEKSRGDFG